MYRHCVRFQCNTLYFNLLPLPVWSLAGESICEQRTSYARDGVTITLQPFIISLKLDNTPQERAPHGDCGGLGALPSAGGGAGSTAALRARAAHRCLTLRSARRGSSPRGRPACFRSTRCWTAHCALWVNGERYGRRIMALGPLRL